jgi:hypothetical protein
VNAATDGRASKAMRSSVRCCVVFVTVRHVCVWAAYLKHGPGVADEVEEGLHVAHHHRATTG